MKWEELEKKYGVKKKKSRKLYYLLPIFLVIVVVYIYTTGAFTPGTQGMELVDSFCEEGTPDKAHLSIRNNGTVTIDTSSITVSRTSPTTATFTWSTGRLEPGKITSESFECDGSSARSCTYRLTPLSGSSITATVYCT